MLSASESRLIRYERADLAVTATGFISFYHHLLDLIYRASGLAQECPWRNSPALAPASFVGMIFSMLRHFSATKLPRRGGACGDAGELRYHAYSAPSISGFARISADIAHRLRRSADAQHAAAPPIDDEFVDIRLRRPAPRRHAAQGE